MVVSRWIRSRETEDVDLAPTIFNHRHVTPSRRDGQLIRQVRITAGEMTDPLVFTGIPHANRFPLRRPLGRSPARLAPSERTSRCRPASALPSGDRWAERRIRRFYQRMRNAPLAPALL